MPKKNKPSKKLHLTDNEKLMVKLEHIARSGVEKSQVSRDLLTWYMVHKEWTFKQLSLVKRLCATADLEKKIAASKFKYNLYAFSDGESIKIGVSTNIGKRMKGVQTGHPKRLNCIWRFYTGTSRTHAYKMEKKLHRVCKKHKLVGEWFSIEALDLVNSFTCERLNEVIP